MCISILSGQTTSHSAENMKEIFEQGYRAYIDAMKLDNKEFPFRSTSYGPRSYQHLQKIAKIGTPVLPYLMKKAAETKDMSLNLPLILITRKSFVRDEWPEGELGGSRELLKLYIDWWEKGRKLTPQKFSQRYSQWKNLKGEGKEDEARKKSEEIRALGIAALPMLMEKVKEGDKELIPIISKLIDGQIDPNASTSQCFAWWQDNKEKWLIPFPNNRPAANAGKGQTVTSGDTVQLDGSASSDEDKDELTYTWTQKEGPFVKLSDQTGAKPTFTAPIVKVPTVLIFELKVNDAGYVLKSCPTPNSESKPDTIKIAVNPKD
jgi:hypothetical protein